MTERDVDELTRGAGYLKEKAIIGLTRVTGDELDRAIMKVTSHMLKAPKEKHMQRLLATTYGHYKSNTRDGKSICRYIVSELEKRMHTHNWIVVLKTLVTFHRLMSDGSSEIIFCIQQNPNLFCFHNLKDFTKSAGGAAQSLFIQQYLSYLEERAVLQGVIGLENRLESVEFSSVLRSMDVGSLQVCFKALLANLIALVNVEYREEIVNNFCTLEAYQKIVDDGKIFYQLLSNRVIFILDGFSDFSVALKSVWLELYRSYSVTVERLRLLFDSILDSYRVFVKPPPRLKPLPAYFAEQLENCVRLDKIPMQNITQSLRSLGICGSGVTTPANETVEKPPPTLPPTETTQPLPGNESSSLPSAPAAAADGGAKQQTLFSMDDLFVGAGAPTSERQAPSAPVDPLEGNQYFPFLRSQLDTNLEAEKTGDHSATSNALLDEGWSTGAPAPSAQYATAAPVTDEVPHTTWGVTTSTANDAPPMQRNNNVFTELYNDEKKGWYAKKM
ncbi:putative clathrin coat assembly protein [Trypanosoma rangeli]|uniref:Putative clathrin coat assembly protein n=1 Tax=Trypanosoma rangeli TaxID=5698 RepID=A0A422P449_TRYRA|nr:putative clathrin coat assembly protein [Trypanosoma rangeli]RNF12489.1 putative clathrin coat assembly protein [Trypanosoma rangeli]|eukprot:RNF12489.1 putative clathrin coat assembly protein [Trypanosoma rangeli]